MPIRGFVRARSPVGAVIWAIGFHRAGLAQGFDRGPYGQPARARTSPSHGAHGCKDESSLWRDQRELAIWDRHPSVAGSNMDLI